jgi:hypothetical protein
LIPAGSLVTVPEPEPVLLTLRVGLGVVKFAMTEAVPVMVKVVLAVELFEKDPPLPDQLLKK